MKPHVPNASDYFNRKRYFSINVQAIVDHKCRFRWWSAITPGASNDAFAFGVTLLASRLHELPVGYWLAADAAYGIGPHILSPFRGANLTPEQDAYNYYLSRSRIRVEMAFGMLVARWGVFWRKIRLDLPKTTLLISVAMKLHNLCIDSNTERLSATSIDQGCR